MCANKHIRYPCCTHGMLIIYARVSEPITQEIAVVKDVVETAGYVWYTVWQPTLSRCGFMAVLGEAAADVRILQAMGRDKLKHTYDK